MVDAGYITQPEADAAFQQELTLRTSVAERFDVLTAPHFALYVLERIKAEYNTAEDPYAIWRKGLRSTRRWMWNCSATPNRWRANRCKS
jgi:membrane peptidoglycan carboxypeptidase